MKTTDSTITISKGGVLVEDRRTMNETVACPLCLANMVKRTGMYGPFYGCIRYPACRGTLEMWDRR